MKYFSHVFHFPASAPFDKPELRLTSFVGEFVKPVVTAHPGLNYWFSYYGDHAKFRVYTDDYEAIRERVETERDRLRLEDRGEEKTLTIVEDIGNDRFIAPDSNTAPLRRAELILQALCANANLVVDGVVQRRDGYWQFEENKNQQNPDGSHLFSVNHLHHNMSASNGFIYLFNHMGQPQVLSYYSFHNGANAGLIQPTDVKLFQIHL